MKEKVNIVLMSVLVLFLSLISFLTGFFVGKEHGYELREKMLQEYSFEKGMVIKEVESDVISFSVAEISPEDYAAYGVAETAENARTLTAEVHPVYAENKKVDFLVSWVNENSEWATGKNVTDYVTVVQATDGARTATVTCYQSFGEQIQINCVPRSNPKVKATCTVDYYCHYESVSLYYSGKEYLLADLTSNRTFANSFSTMTYENVKSWDLIVPENLIVFDSNEEINSRLMIKGKVKGDYTVELGFQYYVNLVPEWREVISGLGYTYDVRQIGRLGTYNPYDINGLESSFGSINENASHFLPSYLTPLSFFTNIDFLDDSGEFRSYLDISASYHDIYYAAKNSVTPLYSIIIYATTGFEVSQTFGCYVKVDSNSIEIPVSEIELDSKQYTFGV